MIGNPSSAYLYTDFQGLAELRAEAGKNSPDAARETARQFEALFVQMMLKAMRAASPGDGMFDSDQVGFYRELYDRQIALHMVQGRGLGIADLMNEQLGGNGDGPEASAEESPGGMLRFEPSAYGAGVPAPGAAQHAAQEMPAAGQSWRPGSRADFVRDLWPHVERGADKLGVRPEVLVAQSALETGWGKKVIARPDGSSSFNLFGIKADARWNGERVSIATLEYEQGVAVQRRESFRAYASIEESVNDYVDFVRGNPRYEIALQKAADPLAYLQGLKQAGYATDPDYVGKIGEILAQGVSREGGE